MALDSSVIEELKVRITAETADLKRELAEVKKQLKDTQQQTENTNRSISNVSGNTAKELVKMGTLISLAKKGLKELIQTGKEGYELLRQYYRGNEELNKSFLKTDEALQDTAQELKISLGTNLSALLMTMQPLLEVLADGLMFVADGFTQVLASIKGEDEYQRVNTQGVKEYTAAVRNAAKEQKALIQGFDELKRLNQSTTIDPADYNLTETVPIDKTLASVFATSTVLLGTAALANWIMKARNATAMTNLLSGAMSGKNDVLTEQNGLESEAAEGLAGSLVPALVTAGAAVTILGKDFAEIFPRAEKAKEGIVTTEAAVQSLAEACGQELPELDDSKFQSKLEQIKQDIKDFLDSFFNEPEINPQVTRQKTSNISASNKVKATNVYFAEAPSEVGRSYEPQTSPSHQRSEAEYQQFLEEISQKSVLEEISDVLGDIMQVFAVAIGGSFAAKGFSSTGGGGGSTDFQEGVRRKLFNAINFAAADGAFDIPRGDVFVANEAGPELVGSIGNKTSVANTNQIIEGIKQGVLEAMNTANGDTYSVQAQFVRQILEAIEDKDLSVSIGDETIARSASNGNKKYYQMTGKSLFD